jgi:RNA polymerase sigma factor (TIGR02999 family)
VSEVTQILNSIDSVDSRAADRLLPLIYDKLRKLAAAKLTNEKPGQTLDATGLVHEAYLRLVGPLAPGESPGAQFQNRAHFFAAAAESMRRILVDIARQKARHKHGGGRQRVELVDVAAAAPPEELLALDEALTRLAQRDPMKAELVKLRFFAGLTVAEVAAALNISIATAVRYWSLARSWLYAELNSDDEIPRDC